MYRATSNEIDGKGDFSTADWSTVDQGTIGEHARVPYTTRAKSDEIEGKGR